MYVALKSFLHFYVNFFLQTDILDILYTYVYVYV